jgi:hypothetical protein
MELFHRSLRRIPSNLSNAHTPEKKLLQHYLIGCTSAFLRTRLATKFSNPGCEPSDKPC